MYLGIWVITEFCKDNYFFSKYIEIYLNIILRIKLEIEIRIGLIYTMHLNYRRPDQGCVFTIN